MLFDLLSGLIFVRGVVHWSRTISHWLLIASHYSLLITEN